MKKSKRKNIIMSIGPDSDGICYEFDVGLICGYKKIDFDDVDKSGICIDATDEHDPKIIFPYGKNSKITEGATRVYSHEPDDYYEEDPSMWVNV